MKKYVVQLCHYSYRYPVRSYDRLRHVIGFKRIGTVLTRSTIYTNISVGTEVLKNSNRGTKRSTIYARIFFLIFLSPQPVKRVPRSFLILKTPRIEPYEIGIVVQLSLFTTTHDRGLVSYSKATIQRLNINHHGETFKSAWNLTDTKKGTTRKFQFL